METEKIPIKILAHKMSSSPRENVPDSSNGNDESSVDVPSLSILDNYLVSQNLYDYVRSHQKDAIEWDWVRH